MTFALDLTEEQTAIKHSDDCLLIPSPFNSRPSGTYPRPYTPTVPMNNNPITIDSRIIFI